jgi:transposase
VFLDESGFLLAPLVRRSWAPCGQPPVLYQRGRHHKKVSAIAALCVSPQRDQVRLYFRLHPGRNINTDLAIEFLRALDQQLQDPWCLLWDRLNAHRAKKTTAYLDTVPHLLPFFLPPYAPELNPVEYVWAYCKMNPLANLAVQEVTDLAKVARHHGHSLQRKPDLLRSFLRHSPLFLRLR